MILDSNNENFIFKCSKCNLDKPNKEYFKRLNDRRVRKYFSSCKDCEKKRVNKWQSTSEKRLEYKLRHLYNLELKEYYKIYLEQEGKCKICGILESNCTKRLAVDHDHNTNIVRGLLCEKCNQGIGMFKDNINLLKNAIEYLINTKLPILELMSL